MSLSQFKNAQLQVHSEENQEVEILKKLNELTISVSCALKLILTKELKDKYGCICIGEGTVLTRHILDELKY